MSGGAGLDTFHLAYVPAKTTDNFSAKVNYCAGAPGPIAIRRATSLRLYRCRNPHPHRDGSGGKLGHACADNSSRKNDSSDCVEQQQNEECECCCCRVEKCSSDFLLPCNPSFSVNTERSNGMSCDDSAKSNMLAVLVPPSLTRNLVNIISQKVANSLEEKELEQLVIDTELELRKSIHPCLFPNESLHTINSVSVESDEKQEGCGQQHQASGDDMKPSAEHPHLFICGIITSNNVSICTNFPADAVLLAPASANSSPRAQNRRTLLFDRGHLLSHYSTLINHETASNAPWAMIKAFPVSTLSILPMDPDTNADIDATAFDKAALPCCPVCLNLIEPSRLGLPELSPQHKCSQWCSEPNGFHNNRTDSGFRQPHCCVNEMKILPWPPPANCISCQTRLRPQPMESRLSLSESSQETAINHLPASLNHSANAGTSISSALKCYQCEMSTTLWICLTCGVVGCGRYTLEHSVKHYTLKGHPYSLELATGRIWDYEKEDFVHRKDLVECPVLSRKWGIAPDSSNFFSPLVASSMSGSSFQRGNTFSESGNHAGHKVSGDDINNYQHDGYEDSIASCNTSHNDNVFPPASKLSAEPKKSMMISQEYEALLQSALEDQSQHYEGEISRLRADLASSRIHDSRVSNRESRDIHALQKDIGRLKQDAERLSSALLEAQTREAKHRSMSQRLLREQSIAKELLEKIQNDTQTEHDLGRQRMEDLEGQITDLTTNLRMISQFARTEELSQAQIFGIIGGEKEKSGKQRGKKSRRGRRRG